MPQDKAAQAAYMRAYHQANKEKITERKREHYQANKDAIAEYRQANKDKIAEYRQANKDKIAEQMREYNQTPRRKKSFTINSWKQIGVVHDDFDALYDHYQSSSHCEDCGKEFAGVIGDGQGAYRCLGHCHKTGAFRAVVCPGCNLRRGA